MAQADDQAAIMRLAVASGRTIDEVTAELIHEALVSRGEVAP